MNLKKFLLITLILLFCSFKLFAQTTISGIIVDGSDNGKLEKATIALLHQQDSMLIKFVWTKDNGSFILNGIDTGKYKLVVSYPKYADYSRDITIGGENENIGTVKLSKASLLLDEVLVTGNIPIVIKGDTTIYNASSFNVGKEANVEDLLKVLPGITVDANGKITAQGKEVKKVLLDGEEFFGDDPKLITKNIRSNMVDKVLVYEKKSDLAVRTGVDDGERTQTIDITLKQDMKKGLFGQALAGGGTDKYYAGKAMVNKFKGSEKIAAYGIVANDGMVSLGFEDGEKYGVGGSSNVSVDGGSIFITSNSEDDFSWDGSYGGNGVPRALNVGASYSNKFDKDKHKINVNFQRRQLDVSNNSTVFSQNNLPDFARIENTTGYAENNTRNNTANVRYDLKMDSLTDLTVKLGYSKNDRDNFTNSNTKEENLDYTLINEIELKENGTSARENMNANFLLTRRFTKERRSLTLSSSITSNSDNSRSNFYSMTEFADATANLEIDQLKNDIAKNTNFSASLNFTEPLSKRWTGTVGYTISKYNSTLLNQSFDKDVVSGEYNILDEFQLNDFDHSNLSNGLSLGANYKSEKLTLNVSNRFNYEKVDRLYNNIDKELNRNQNSIAPALSINYKLSKSKSLNFRYNGRTTQPNLNQIEPLNQNRDTRITYLANPDLKSGFSNSYNLSYNSYKPLKDQSFYVGTYFSQAFNTINSKVDYDASSGQRDISFVNIEKANVYANLYGSYRRPIWKKYNLSANVGAGFNYDNSYNYLSVNGGNSALNNNESYRISPNLGFNSYKAEKWSFYMNFSPGVQFRSSSLQGQFDSESFTFSSYMNFSYTLPKAFKIGFNGSQSYEAATQTLAAYSVVNLNGYVSKKFLKDKSLELQFLVNDIFNRNNGVRRYQSGYSFTQSTNDVLRRFAMLKLIYNFTSMKGGE